MTQIEPANIELDVRKELKITWYDTHESHYPLDYLRQQCPCATCQTKRREDEDKKKSQKANPFTVLTGKVVKQVEALNVEPVGNYAIRFDWNDDHNSGIYTFEYLRRICPCEECASQRKAGDRPK